jgi:uracil-DNA glycosylase family 4
MGIRAEDDVCRHPADAVGARLRDAQGREFHRLVRDVRACTACNRMQHSHVLGEANGDLDARVLVVAEAVGRRGGAVTGVPLTRDASGRRFRGFLDAAGLSRRDVFITNAVLCNPLDTRGCNRTPTMSEIARCRPFLTRTIELVRAPLVVALGRVALESLGAIATHDARLARDVGRGIAWNGRTLVPMYHPSQQSTLHRPHEDQVDDWRQLGNLIHDRFSVGR